jgi:hypothetical protein
MMILAVQPAHKIGEGEVSGGEEGGGLIDDGGRGGKIRITLGQNCERLRPAPATGPGTRKPSQSSRPVSPRNDCARLNGR